jgi:hypothetical protein
MNTSAVACQPSLTWGLIAKLAKASGTPIVPSREPNAEFRVALTDAGQKIDGFEHQTESVRNSMRRHFDASLAPPAV